MINLLGIRKIEKNPTEEMILREAIKEKTPAEIKALCTWLGFRRAYECILMDYKIKHGHNIKD